MPRSVSDTFKAAVFAQDTDEAFLMLITINHDDLGAPIRVVTSGSNITSRGETYVAVPVEVTLPNDLEGAQPQAGLKIDNLDPVIISTLRQIRSSPTVTIEIVLESDPETVEITLPEFNLRNVDYDALTISGTLEVEDLSAEPFPCDLFTPALFPGIF